jgi:hypothetical protein
MIASFNHSLPNAKGHACNNNRDYSKVFGEESKPHNGKMRVNENGKIN